MEQKERLVQIERRDLCTLATVADKSQDSHFEGVLHGYVHHASKDVVVDLGQKVKKVFDNDGVLGPRQND